MIKLFNKETGGLIGTISEDQLEFLIDQLEEEDSVDQDYYIHRDTLEYFAEQGAEAPLLELLRRALGDKEEMEIRWATA